ncbi:MAG: hypothetical protein LBG20_01070 [Holosporaceae bacterium]|jgi:hypothetical protein|nr:hypothetical protein [Holosporaceae bacterium]
MKCPFRRGCERGAVPEILLLVTDFGLERRMGGGDFVNSDTTTFFISILPILTP